MGVPTGLAPYRARVRAPLPAAATDVPAMAALQVPPGDVQFEDAIAPAGAAGGAMAPA